MHHLPQQTNLFPGMFSPSNHGLGPQSSGDISSFTAQQGQLNSGERVDTDSKVPYEIPPESHRFSDARQTASTGGGDSRAIGLIYTPQAHETFVQRSLVYHQAAQYHISHGSLRQPEFAGSSQYMSSPQATFYAAMEASQSLASLTQQLVPPGNDLARSGGPLDVLALGAPHTNRGELFITFECTGHGGLRLDLVLRGDMQGLEDPLSRDCFQGFGDKVSYKIPRGSKLAYTVQRRCRRSRRKQPVYIQRVEVVHQIAEFTRAFIEAVPDFPAEPGFEDWRAGYNGLENFVLVGLKRVSKASVQPVYQYRSST